MRLCMARDVTVSRMNTWREVLPSEFVLVRWEGEYGAHGGRDCFYCMFVVGCCGFSSCLKIQQYHHSCKP